jgi:carboxylesterase
MIGCLCLHGFTGGPFEVEPIADYLSKSTDWLIVNPALPGHENPKKFYKVPYQDWINTAEDAIQTLRETCDTIYVIGFSMGGLIAGHLAVKYPIDKLILLSPAVFYIDAQRMFVDIRNMIADGFRGKLKQNDLFLRYQRKMKTTPFSMTLEFRKLVRSLRPSLSKINAPTLIIHGEQDALVPRKSAEYLYEKILNEDKRIHYLKRSKHVICHDVEQAELMTQVLHFLGIEHKEIQEERN